MRGFGDLESEIMDRLWAWHRLVTVREVLDDLQRERQIAYTTVMTVMDNLHRKGWLRRERDGRAYRYEPVASREEYSAGLMREALTSSTNHTATLVHFMEHMTPGESAALRRALRKLGRGQGR
ncbi:MAG: CopY family transcriptional regulator [Pseudonocardiales bacterium]|nr:MAG: CopY family transcriptional regulator [Pseudonocardiales bacterium]